MNSLPLAMPGMYFCFCSSVPTSSIGAGDSELQDDITRLHVMLFLQISSITHT
jgi:hypothetical protein